MTRAAIYGRRSTDEHQEASIEVQTSEARAFVERNGWTLDERHVFLDDAVSRAEFKKRPALIALLNAVGAGEVEAVVTRDETRLGGDMTRTGLLIGDIVDGGARLFYYYTGEEVTLEGAVDRFMVAARNFAAELEREKVSQRTHEHLHRKARKGYVTGGTVYGYDNVRVDQHVEHRVNEEEAAVIREIFARYRDGDGLRTIAKDLNARRVPPPRAGRRGTGSWSYSAIREIVRRDRYRGLVVWNRYEKAYRGGTKVRVERPEDEWVRVEVPELRIVPEPLWLAVKARLARHQSFAGPGGKRGRVTRYLLTGFARCETCGGPMQVLNSKQGARTIKVYACSWHRNRGAGACSNSLRRPVEAVDEAVVGWLKANVLTEEVVAATLREVRRRLAERSKRAGEEIPALREQERQNKRDIDRLTEALLATDERPHAIVRAISEREQQLRAVEARIEALLTAPEVLDLEVRRLEKEAAKRLADLRGLLRRRPEEAHRALEALLPRPLTFAPVATGHGPRYEVQGPVIAHGALFTTEGVPNGIRTRVAGVKGRSPGPD